MNAPLLLLPRVNGRKRPRLLSSVRARLRQLCGAADAPGTAEARLRALAVSQVRLHAVRARFFACWFAPETWPHSAADASPDLQRARCASRLGGALRAALHPATCVDGMLAADRADALAAWMGAATDAGRVASHKRERCAAALLRRAAAAGAARCARWLFWRREHSFNAAVPVRFGPRDAMECLLTALEHDRSAVVDVVFAHGVDLLILCTGTTDTATLLRLMAATAPRDEFEVRVCEVSVAAWDALWRAPKRVGLSSERASADALVRRLLFGTTVLHNVTHHHLTFQPLIRMTNLRNAVLVRRPDMRARLDWLFDVANIAIESTMSWTRIVIEAAAERNFAALRWMAKRGKLQMADAAEVRASGRSLWLRAATAGDIGLLEWLSTDTVATAMFFGGATPTPISARGGFAAAHGSIPVMRWLRARGVQFVKGECAFAHALSTATSDAAARAAVEWLLAAGLTFTFDASSSQIWPSAACNHCLSVDMLHWLLDTAGVPLVRNNYLWPPQQLQDPDYHKSLCQAFGALLEFLLAPRAHAAWERSVAQLDESECIVAVLDWAVDRMSAALELSPALNTGAAAVQLLRVLDGASVEVVSPHADGVAHRLWRCAVDVGHRAPVLEWLLRAADIAELAKAAQFGVLATLAAARLASPAMLRWLLARGAGLHPSVLRMLLLDAVCDAPGARAVRAAAAARAIVRACRAGKVVLPPTAKTNYADAMYSAIGAGMGDVAAWLWREHVGAAGLAALGGARAVADRLRDSPSGAVCALLKEIERSDPATAGVLVNAFIIHTMASVKFLRALVRQYITKPARRFLPSAVAWMHVQDITPKRVWTAMFKRITTFARQ